MIKLMTMGFKNEESLEKFRKMAVDELGKGVFYLLFTESFKELAMESRVSAIENSEITDEDETRVMRNEL